MRMESLEVSQQIMTPNNKDLLQPHNVELGIASISKIGADEGISIKLVMHDIDKSDLEDYSNSDNVSIENNTTAKVLPNISDADVIKNIDNFTVMKRYIKSKDKTGNILRK